MSDASIYSQINTLRQAAHDEYTAKEGRQQFPLAPLDGSDWTEDSTYGRTLGDPETDYSVTITGDTVTIYAAGVDVSTAEIAGAGEL